MKGWDPEKLGRTIVDGSTQIGRTGFSRRGSSYSDFCCQSGCDPPSIGIGIYHETLCPFVDTPLDLVMLLSTDGGGWGEKTGIPLWCDHWGAFPGDSSVHDRAPDWNGLRQCIGHSFTCSGRVYHDDSDNKDENTASEPAHMTYPGFSARIGSRCTFGRRRLNDQLLKCPSVDLK